MSRFSFLPRWRIDDLMISVAGPGGSVGPHVDQYDVFLLQAEGKRRWEIAESYDAALLPDCELKVLQDFCAEQEWLLEPGDMLYLPPGIAHHGVALDAGMTWSIGMRAPSRADVFLALGEWLAEKDDEGGRYQDPGLTGPRYPGEIDSAAMSRLEDFLRSAFPAGAGPPLVPGNIHLPLPTGPSARAILQGASTGCAGKSARPGKNTSPQPLDTYFLVRARGSRARFRRGRTIFVQRRTGPDPV